MRYKDTVKLWWAVSILVSALLLAVISPTYAAETGGIGGKPANPRAENPRTESIFVYELKPGESTNDAVEIYNNTEEQKTIKVYSTDSIISSGGAFACAQAADSINDVGNWIKLSKELVTLSPNKSEKVPFTITIPDYAEPGEHNGCIAMQESDAEAAAVGNGIALSFRSAIRVAITIPGDIKKELTIRDVSLKQKADILVGTILLRNNGNVSLDTSVATKLVNFWGTQVESINGTYPALPQTVTELNFEYKQPYWGGLYRLNVAAAYNANTTESLGEGGDSSSVASSSNYVFITPRPLALLIELAVLVVIGLGIWYLVRRYILIPRMTKKYDSYIVAKDEDIQQIAKRYNTSWKHLARVNAIKAPYTIKQGDILKVPHNKATKASANIVAAEAMPKDTSKAKNTNIPKVETLATVAIKNSSESQKSSSKKPTTSKKVAKKTTKATASAKTKVAKKKPTKKKTTKPTSKVSKNKVVTPKKTIDKE